MLAEDKKIIPLLKSANYGAGVDMDSFKAEGHDVTLILTFGAVTGNAVLKVYSGATAGTKTSSLTNDCTEDDIGFDSFSTLRNGNTAASRLYTPRLSFGAFFKILYASLRGTDFSSAMVTSSIGLNAVRSGKRKASVSRIVDCPIVNVVIMWFLLNLN